MYTRNITVGREIGAMYSLFLIRIHYCKLTGPHRTEGGRLVLLIPNAVLICGGRTAGGAIYTINEWYTISRQQPETLFLIDDYSVCEFCYYTVGTSFRCRVPFLIYIRLH